MTSPTLDQWPTAYVNYRAVVGEHYAADIEWSQTVGPPANAVAFALEVAYVIINSGMKWKVAKGIYRRVEEALVEKGGVPRDIFGHEGKRDAINWVWKERNRLFQQLGTALASGPDVALAFCAGLPWIGDITKYHLAKNFGVDCAKPDRHLERVARAAGTDPHALCEAISKAHGDRIATVDYVIWRACEMGLL